ncbi:putative transferase, protein kinase RLK-Pelle-LRR-Xa family [Helianthus annuus]|uniref:Transferase, protein kinase RLK-Pelle-LRR-Xa family n=1 Tax=Helianthus annuus TaxID=4232 RepID=A0A251UPA8_HELAN|nr:probably inactive leucine-rich repeat receptor-like protein kinase At5g48380 [Helianthus annuus]KAF5805884.1 putative transferase, protein kinase RLK-Pelle-LRR-Xa family [Helianthus annuus]
MGLRGSFPMGLRSCTSMQHLDLSGNYLSGSIPSNLAKDLPYIVSLYLSNNNLSGPIPPSFANFNFINVLRLDNNHLTGEIPSEFSKLPRLHEFSIANNRLSGPVPILPYCKSFPKNYANNIGLCGGPLDRCKKEDDEDHFFSGLAVGLLVSTTLTTLLMLFRLHRSSMINMRSYLSTIKKIRGMKHHFIPRRSQILFIEENITEESKIIAMEKYVCRLSLMELEIATNDFDHKKVIGYGNMGLMYKAKFLNGLTLAVKRLHKFESFEKEFLLEIEILGRLRHTNLVPLLGFCYEMEKKFLIYKYMSNGNLHQWLHTRPQVEGKKMGWTMRLRIAVGIARGLAWLHHNNVLRVAHLKMNSNCILLDDKFEPKISNFGDSNILMNTSGTPSSACNFVVPHSSPAPYKEDVYSFGLLLLELVSGRERRSEGYNSSCDNVCDWEIFNMIDGCLMGQGFNEEIYETLRIAESCIETHKGGGTSMLQVYQAIRVVGKSRNENSTNLFLDVEDREGNT